MAKNQRAQRGGVGGQALIEGVMMKGPNKTAMAIRKADGSIYKEIIENNKKPPVVFKAPLLRGLYNYISQMAEGYKILMKSADISGFAEEEEPGKFELWLEKTFGSKASTFIFGVAGVLAVILSVFLFMFLPTFLVSQLDKVITLGYFKNILEGVMKIVILVGYLALTARMQEMKRIYQYHGAEHKSIFCYEAGEELTVENVRKQPRFHPMCGTSFLLLVVVVSVLVFSFISWGSPFVRTLIKLACLPITLGLTYEAIRYVSRHDNVFTKILAAPGLWLQRLTTSEPDDSQIEIAIAALKPVLGLDEEVKENEPVGEQVPIQTPVSEFTQEAKATFVEEVREMQDIPKPEDNTLLRDILQENSPEAEKPGDE